MRSGVADDGEFSWSFFLTILLSITAAAIVLQAHSTLSVVVVPNSSCYAFDNSSHIYDFTNWVGHPFDYDGKGLDLAVRFCKDVETRSQTGFVKFGRYDKLNYFVSGSGRINFVQRFDNGDLVNCETSYDKMGRTAQVNVICGSCLNGQCKGLPGCICDVTYESTCRVIIELAIPCEKQGLRVFEGFTVGFHPRSSEVVYNGLTQLGFEKAHHGFSFGTEQTHVALYLTAIASQSGWVRKPVVKSFPERGLEVKLSGSGALGRPPTTLSPTVLMLDWMCVHASEIPYEVDITIPVEGYEAIQFTLTKTCEYAQSKVGDATRGWAIFGVLSCIFIVSSTIVCCGGFVYNTQVRHQRGLEALPGMTILSACIESVGGTGQSDSRAQDLNTAFAKQVSWGQQPASAQGTSRTTEKRYGSI